MEGGGQVGGSDRGQNAVNASNSTQDDPLLPPTDSSSPCTLEWLKPQNPDVINNLRLLQQDGGVSDFTLHLKEGPLRFSRVLLASMSPFFQKLVTVDMEESRSSEVLMPHVTQDTWTCITSFYFSSQMLVSIHNVQDVLETSRMYGLETLVQYCCEFMQSHCCADNCLGISKLAKHFELESLAEEAKRVLSSEFSTVCKGEEFLCLEKTELLELLENEEVVVTEDDLCQALLAWMEKNNADADTCSQVFRYLRLKLISDEFLRTIVVCHNVCMRSPFIQSLVTEESSRRMQCKSHRQMQRKARRRRPQSAKNSLLFFGDSWSRNFLVFAWSFHEREWATFPGPPFKARKTFSGTALEDIVIITGGMMNQSTHFFDLRTLEWSTGPDLQHGRTHPGMTTVGHTAYVVGGSDNSIEEYSKASGQWTATGCLQEFIGECGVAALGDTILVVGGYSQEVAWLIQTFNVHTRSAAVLDDLLPRAMHNVMAASNGTSVFFVGEEGDLVQIEEEEGKLQMSSNAKLENFTPELSWFGLQATKSYLQAFGGFFSPSLFCWDFKGKSIKNDDVENLPEGMSGLFALEVNISP